MDSPWTPWTTCICAFDKKSRILKSIFPVLFSFELIFFLQKYFCSECFMIPINYFLQLSNSQYVVFTKTAISNLFISNMNFDITAFYKLFLCHLFLEAAHMFECLRHLAACFQLSLECQHIAYQMKNKGHRFADKIEFHVILIWKAKFIWVWNMQPHIWSWCIEICMFLSTTFCSHYGNVIVNFFLSFPVM